MGAWTLAVAGMAGAAQQVQKLAPPDWVESMAPPPASAAPADKSQAGAVYLLADMQTRVEPAGGKQAWRHFAVLARDPQAVESLANVEIGFDPSYQTLSLHLLRVHRGGQVQDRLATAQVRVLQRERDLETLIFDGSRTASIFLDDVRVGDVIEYAYSISGSNPVFGGRHFGSFDLQWSRPLTQLRVRLLWPGGRPVSLHGAPTEIAVDPHPLGAYAEYRLQRDNVPGLRVESNAPGWYDPFATLYWSEFKSWPDVAAWALPLYRVPAELPAPLRAERDRILATYSSPAARAAAALRWVQGEIRYLGIEVGANSHAPTPPALVVSRRFGDCKDKTLVAVTLLRALGLQAEPALVNTERQKGVDRGLPMPGAFNHVIVRLRLDGSTYWLDPTRRPQPGGLDSLSQPDWGLALPVNADGAGLIAMDSGAASRSLRNVHLLVDASAGLNAPTTLTVTSELSGRTAEAERAAHAEEGTDRVQQRYLNFYATDYPGLRVAAPLELHDDPDHNRLRVVEHYAMDPIFQHSAEHKRLEAEFQSPEMRSLLNTPRESVRQAPLALGHPVDMTHELEIRLPEGWPLKTKVSEVKNAAFTLRHEMRGESPVGGEFRVIKLIDHYESRADHIDASAVAGYAADLEKARGALGYNLYKRDDAPAETLAGGSGGSGGGRFNLTVALFAVLVLLALVWALPRLYRWDPAPPPGQGQPFNGWLWWIGISVVVTPFRTVTTLFDAMPAFELQTWNLLTTPGTDSYHPWMSALLLGELAVLMAQLSASLLLAVVYFRRRSSAPVLYVAIMWTCLVISVLDDHALRLIPSLAEQAEHIPLARWIGGGILLAFYTVYLLCSSRARLSFTERHRKAPAGDLLEAVPIIPV
jgi:hypothetical protein